MDNKPKYWSPKAGEKGMTQLHYAAYCQDLAAVKYWVEHGYDVNEKTDVGWTAINWCIDMADTSREGVAEAIIDYLVEHGAKLEFNDGRDSSLLEFARAYGSRMAEHLEKIMLI